MKRIIDWSLNHAFDDPNLESGSFVRVRVNALDPIPAGANPFHHDAYLMGTSLPRGWVVMHEGYDKEAQYPMHFLVLVNKRSGQRVQLVFEKNDEPAFPKEQDIISGMYGGLAYRARGYHHSHYWRCRDSDYAWTAVVDDFGDLVQVGQAENLRGY